MISAVVLTLRFLLELAMLVSVAVWGASVGDGVAPIAVAVSPALGIAFLALAVAVSLANATVEPNRRSGPTVNDAGRAAGHRPR